MIRIEKDGTHWIPRRNPEAERELDGDPTLMRVAPGELRWKKTAMIPGGTDMRDALELRAIFNGINRAFLIGKGPSLDRWRKTPGMTNSSAVVALNETAMILPPTIRARFCVFVDYAIQRGIVLPPGCSPMIPPALAGKPLRGLDAPVYVFQYRPEYGIKPEYTTATIALCLLSLMGIKNITAIGFDGFDGDHSTSGEDVYADSVNELGVTPARENADYHIINRHMREVIDTHKLNVAWFHRQ